MNRLIRYATLVDSNILGEIHSESLQEAFKSIIPDHILNEEFCAERRAKGFTRELSEASPKTAIAFEGNESAGLISFGKSRYDNNDTPWIEIWRVYIIPKFWGNGLAKDLMEWAVKEVQEKNFTNIELWVFEENIRARKFYEKIGFIHDNNLQVINVGNELKELRYIKSFR
ncbi:GNAT family N-acetyltransferase [Anaerosolibacter sp.]|uniref:GNAT family N-acetyltransferase n=1 Tax=Anaerosolibacter sp. TaxID=1872527 RepID=UPI0039F096DA